MLKRDVQERLAAMLDRLEGAGLSPLERAALESLVREAAGESALTFSPEMTIAPEGEPTFSAAPPTLAPSLTFELDAPTGAPTGAPDPHNLGPLAARYQVRRRLGVGGMSDVWQVEDRRLHRTMALKVMKPELLGRPEARARFVEEAQLTAQLQHPGILPVHEVGELPDGRAWFTMKEVHGRTLREVLREAHDDEAGLEKHELHGLVSDFHRSCEAVAYAHAQGVVHRDLKPDNIMMGDFGEVLVLDWGLARVDGRAARPSDEAPGDAAGASAGAPAGWEQSIQTDRSDEFITRIGHIAGTPAYMPPEQATGDFHTLTPTADVYALGAVLFEILAGEAPFGGRSPTAILEAVVAGRRRPLPSGGVVPDELRAICERAMSEDPGRRYRDAASLARAVEAWLDGQRQKERALAFAQTADALGMEIDELRERSEGLRERAREALKAAPRWAPAADKRAAWAMEDEADGLQREADLRELMRIEALRAALVHLPEYVEVNDTLFGHFQRLHGSAEVNRDPRAMSLLEARVRLYDRGRHTDYLRGRGRLSLTVEPAGAEVRLHRYELRDRCLTPTFVRALGPTPLDDLPMAMGSYLLELRAPGREVVLAPACIERQGRWSAAIVLPPAGSVAEDERYVPAGGFVSGGDPAASASQARRSVWVPGFILRRFPITNAEYIDFLDALVADGREAEALAHVPRQKPGRHGEQGAMIYGRRADGGFALQVDADGDEWRPEWPVGMVTWTAAAAYCAWLSERTGQPWRLPWELEWEKAARGVDGRFYPWGDFLDPSFCCIQHSAPGAPLPAGYEAFPIDESPYGVRAMAGTVREWCQDAWSPEGPAPEGGEWRPMETDPDPRVPRSVRGGGFSSNPRTARIAQRTATPGHNRMGSLGFRPARSWSPEG